MMEPTWKGGVRAEQTHRRGRGGFTIFCNFLAGSTTVRSIVDAILGPCSIAGHVPTLPLVRSRVWVRVRLGSGLATEKGWVGMWPVTRLVPKSVYNDESVLPPQVFGIGSVAQMVLSNWKFGNFFSVNFSWGVGVMMGCYWAGGVSGKQPRRKFVFDVTAEICDVNPRWRRCPTRITT